MSGIIRVRPVELKNLSQGMKSESGQIFDGIETMINSRDSHNETLAIKSQKERRQARIYDNMFLRVNNAGLSKLITSFAGSYNRSEEVSVLNKVINKVNPLPSSVRDRFLLNLPGETRETTKWYVGGDEWGSFGTSQTVLKTRHSSICATLAEVCRTIDFHRGDLERFAQPRSPLRYNSKQICGFASRAFITRLNYVSEDAVIALDGVGGRAGRTDAIVATVRNVLDVLGRNMGIANAKGAELAEQAMAVAEDAEAFDSQSATQISNMTCTIAMLHNPLLKRSEVDLAIYRAEMLNDGKSIESALADQHQQRYDALEKNLTASMRDVAEYISNPHNGHIAAFCESAI